MIGFVTSSSRSVTVTENHGTFTENNGTVAFFSDFSVTVERKRNEMRMKRENRRVPHLTVVAVDNLECWGRGLG